MARTRSRPSSRRREDRTCLCSRSRGPPLRDLAVSRRHLSPALRTGLRPTHRASLRPGLRTSLAAEALRTGLLTCFGSARRSQVLPPPRPGDGLLVGRRVRFRRGEVVPGSLAGGTGGTRDARGGIPPEPPGDKHASPDGDDGDIQYRAAQRSSPRRGGARAPGGPAADSTGIGRGHTARAEHAHVTQSNSWRRLRRGPRAVCRNIRPLELPRGVLGVSPRSTRTTGGCCAIWASGPAAPPPRSARNKRGRARPR